MLVYRTYRKIYKIYIYAADEEQVFIATHTIGADTIDHSDEKKWKPRKLAQTHCVIRFMSSLKLHRIIFCLRAASWRDPIVRFIASLKYSR